MLKVAFSAFVMVFLAELGDKTQLAVFSLATESRSSWAVFVGAGAALLLSTALAVLLAGLVERLIPAGWTRGLHIAAGCLFLLAGAWTIFKA
jgi:putative Ca2+/H+ antiporter (TMEM165/GDT1 family)